MRFGSRKFLLTLAGIAAICGLSYLGKLDGTVASSVSGLIVAYLTANVGQKKLVPE
jgi:hypothetical protein